MTVSGSKRMTVTFVPGAVEALDSLVKSTRLNQTDVVNRALQVYHFIESEQAKGRVIRVDDERLWIL